MSKMCPGALTCSHCHSDNMVVEGVNGSVICLTCCATGPSALGYKQYKGETNSIKIAIMMWNERNGEWTNPDISNAVADKARAN